MGDLPSQTSCGDGNHNLRYFTKDKNTDRGGPPPPRGSRFADTAARKTAEKQPKTDGNVQKPLKRRKTENTSKIFSEHRRRGCRRRAAHRRGRRRAAQPPPY